MADRCRIKVCCIADHDESRRAIAAGADAIGLVAEMPSGPGPIPDELIREIARGVPPPIATFLLTSRCEPDDVVAHLRFCETNVVQLVDEVPDETYTALREHHPAVRIVQVVHVEGESSLTEARRVAAHVDAILLDSGRPKAGTRRLGGTGETHDWSVSARIAREVGVPVFLAGGLNPENVAEAIRRVRPFGVDLCSGLRTGGALDEEKLRSFVAAVAAADDG